ncbi:MAG: hypothetical protein IPL65_10930 [Lewinellaceae bacterium]|nr:hypothetical protein [Lewinellaceae bacterium]
MTKPAQRWTPIIAAIAAFCVYASMYAFRKPFTAATFSGYQLAGIDFKIWLVLAQTLGYALSKFIGIRFIAELKTVGRRQVILLLIGTAWLALLGFALVPAPWNIVFLFLNGLPLGMVFGVVFSYLEGRRTTELLGAVLASSFIFSSGLVKSVGKWLMLQVGVGEFWMPFATGSIFILPVFMFSWLLEKVPPPTAEDRAQRTVRKAMSAADRNDFVSRFKPGLVLMVLTYLLLTVLRDVRDNFAAEIWADLGLGNNAAIFTATEIPVTLGILVVMSLLVLVQNNFRAMFYNHAFVVGGFFIALFSTLFFQWHWLSATSWFTLAGLGLFLGYVPFNCLLFDRLLANFKYPGNVGFIMYIADAFGYLGSVSVLFVREFMEVRLSWSIFLQDLLIYCSLAGIVLMSGSWWYFFKKQPLNHG